MSHGCLGILQKRLLPGEILQPPCPNGWDRLCCVYTWFINHSFLLLTFYIGHGFVRMSWLCRHCPWFHVRLWQQPFFCNFLSLNSTVKLLLYLQSITTLDVKSIAPCTCLTVSEFWVGEWSSVPINLNVILFLPGLMKNTVVYREIIAMHLVLPFPCEWSLNTIHSNAHQKAERGLVNWMQGYCLCPLNKVLNHI